MNILLINCILATAQRGVIKKATSIKDTMAYNFALGFLANGHTVTLAASADYKPVQDENYEFDIIFFNSAFPKLFKPDLLPYPKGLRQYLKENQKSFDLVISSESFSIATLLAFSVCKKKLIIWQEMAKHQNKFFKLPAKLWYNIIVRFFLKDNLIVPRSEPAKMFIKSYAKVVSEDFVDHGVNGNKLVPSDISDSSFIVLSQLIPRKNIDSIIRIFKEFIANTKYKEFKLHIIGDGEEYKKLKTLISNLGMGESIFLHGFMNHDNMKEYLKNAKALLIYTSQDNNMVSISESILSGTPILTNNIPTNSFYIKKNHLGIVKDNWNYLDLVGIIENYDLYHKACLKVRDELTNVGAAKKMISIYNKWNSGCNNT